MTQDYALVYPIDSKQRRVLLGKKRKTGKWIDYFNGFGGKRESGESFKDCAYRELVEETGMYIGKAEIVHRANLIFEHQDNTWGPNIVRVYTVPWKDTDHPEATAEMAYQAFSIYELPWRDMPPADRHWLPQVLHSEYMISARFTYRTIGDVSDHLHIITFDKPRKP